MADTLPGTTLREAYDRDATAKEARIAALLEAGGCGGAFRGMRRTPVERGYRMRASVYLGRDAPEDAVARGVDPRGGRMPLEETLWVLPEAARPRVREVAERLAAKPGSKTYGATSALAQLACDVRVERRIPRTVFHPVPNVESALAVMRRTGPPPAPAVAALVHAAFAHRRKALAGSLALAPGAPPGIREQARAELERLGHPPDARAERLKPQDFAALAEALPTLESRR